MKRPPGTNATTSRCAMGRAPSWGSCPWSGSEACCSGTTWSRSPSSTTVARSAATDAVQRSLADAAVARARADGVKLLELRSRGALPLDLPVSHRKITVVLDLPAGQSRAALQVVRGKLRSQIRRPQKEGVIVRFGAGSGHALLRGLRPHMRDLGTPTQPRRLFETIAEVFPDAWFGLRLPRRPPGGRGCRVSLGWRVRDDLGVFAVRVQQACTNMLLYWSFMERAIAEGVTLFNFGRCSPVEGPIASSGSGARAMSSCWYQYAPRGEAATPSPDDGAYAWGPRIWRRLPLPVATALGPWIVRSIP